jgi:hypothetical protein
VAINPKKNSPHTRFIPSRIAHAPCYVRRSQINLDLASNMLGLSMAQSLIALAPRVKVLEDGTVLMLLHFLH